MLPPAVKEIALNSLCAADKDMPAASWPITLSNLNDQVAQRVLPSGQSRVPEQRHPYLRALSQPRPLKVGGGHTDYRGRMTVENHGLTDDVLGAVKLLLPETVADNGDEPGGIRADFPCR